MTPRKIKRSSLIILAFLCLFILACPCNVNEAVDEYIQTLQALRKNPPNKNPLPAQGDQPGSINPHGEGTPGEHTDNVFIVTGTPNVPVPFQQGDCRCGDFTVRQSSAEPGYLLCDYGWMGPTDVYNRFTLSILQQTTIELTRVDFNETLTRVIDKGSSAQVNASEDQHMNVIQDDDTGYIYALTYPINSNTLTCGDGLGTILANGAFKVYLEMESCDYSMTEQDYVNAMKQMKNCALVAVEGYPE